MKSAFKRIRAMALVGGVGALTSLSGAAAAQTTQAASTLLGVNCNAPPAYHCPDTECLGSVITQPGNNVELKTRRTFFLDCPAGYKPGDKVNLVLSLHGAGSYANWQRNYFPVMDVKDKYRLVVITPGSPTRTWSDYDDVYLQNMVDLVVGAVGKQNVERFILAGHSQGGMTSNRIICTPYFRDKVDVRISLSGGRMGPTTPAGRGFANAGPPVWRQEPGAPPAPAQSPRIPTPTSGPPGGDCDYSFIFTNGEYETIPGEASPLAQKFGCGPRLRQDDVVDPKQGYVWDSSRQDPGSDGWGRYPKSGRAQVFTYPNCRDGRVVADVVRLQKGHTEGLEPNVTSKIMELATAAKGGKIAAGSWSPPPPPAAPANPLAPR